MGSREKILGRIRSQKQGRQTHKIEADTSMLVEEFTKALTAARGEVVRCSTLNDAIRRYRVFCLEVQAKRIVLNRDAPADAGLQSGLPEVEFYHVGHTEGDLRAFCASADIGVTGVESALAQTGSICVSYGVGKSRLTTLLPTIHVAFVAVESILPDIFTWTGTVDGPLPSSLMLISGPSKTADIERVLTVGVHGPKRLVVFLYNG